MLVIY
jgi:hypothetical protein